MASASLSGGLKARDVIARGNAPGLNGKTASPERAKQPRAQQLRECPFLECGDISPLSDWQTCLPVRKRGHARALQIRTLPKLWHEFRPYRPWNILGHCSRAFSPGYHIADFQSEDRPALRAAPK